MGTVYNFIQTITCNGNTVVLTPERNYTYRKNTIPEDSGFTIDTFEQLQEYVKQGRIYSAYLNKKAIFMDYGLIKFMARHFKPIKIEEKYKLIRKASLSDLLQFLPADEMAEWLKDHDLIGIPAKALTNN